MSGLDDVATRVYAGPVIASLPHSHMLRHRKRRIRAKWERRLERPARMAFVAETLRVLREAAGG